MENPDRGRVRCATGGGKTIVEFDAICHSLFNKDKSIAVLVAPTISLLTQHHVEFENLNLFNEKGVKVVHFRTGPDAKSSDCTFDEIDVVKTTDEEHVVSTLTTWKDCKTLIFVTFASEQRLFELMKKHGFQAGLVVWDEFHHCIKQEEAYKTHLLNIPAEKNLFFSASDKRGPILSSLHNNDVFGELLCDVTYKELREAAIVVPKILIKPIYVTSKYTQQERFSTQEIEHAKENEYDLKDLELEKNAIIAAYRDMLGTIGSCNMVTFSKSVPIVKALSIGKPSIELKNELDDCFLQGVWAGSMDRDSVFRIVKSVLNSVLVQHSIVKEGIDVIAFNSLLLSRKLDVISLQQAIGRIVRSNKEDKKNFDEGKLSLNDPRGWKKYYATLYVIVRDEDMNNYKEYIRDILEKLHAMGLSESDFQWVDAYPEERTKVEFEREDATVSICTPYVEGMRNTQELVAALEIELEEVRIRDDFKYEFSRKSNNDVFAALIQRNK